MTYPKPKDDLPEYVGIDIQIDCYKTLWDDLYCGVSSYGSNAERYFFVGPSISRVLSENALQCGREIGSYIVFEEGALGILILEITHIPAFVDYDSHTMLRLQYISTLEYVQYFRDRGGIPFPEEMQKQAKLFALENDWPEPETQRVAPRLRLISLDDDEKAHVLDQGVIP